MTKLFSLLILVIVSASAWGDTAVQNQYKNISVEFDNGDSGTIDCDDERTSCVVGLSIYGKRVSYTQVEMDAIKKLGDIIPDRLELTRLSESKGWFRFVYHYWCPNSVRKINAFSQCYASVTVKKWAIESIRSYGQADDTFPIK